MRTLTNFLILTFILSAGIVRAQDNGTCAQNLSIFYESVKIKNYDVAYEPWVAVRQECPSLNINIYTSGEKLLKARIKAADATTKNAEIQDLVKLYDQWIQYFPLRKGKSLKGNILSKKAKLLLDTKTGTTEEIFAIFDEAFTTDIKSFSDFQRLYLYFESMHELYKKGNSGITAEKLFDKYEEVSEKLELEGTITSKKLDNILNKETAGKALSKKDLRNKKIYDRKLTQLSKVIKNLDAIISIESSCENLIPLYQRNFEENKNNSVWLNRAASRMKNKECSDDPLFVTIVEALHTIDPSANSAYYLGILNDKRGNSSEALRYYEESITLQTDPYKKAKILLKIAKEFEARGRKSKARSYANKALKFQPSLGSAYLLISRLYASSANSCGTTQFEKRAIYWLAAETARKAGRVDASLKKTAEQNALSHEGRAPSKTDIFTEGNAGTVIEFSCWFKGSVKVPNL
ncbi:hypothetical protein N9M11_02445 [Flavobacteriaceae bacterium]|uniref:hypothetical protein n=1 Tax=Candidatus Arcticimaribacter forsetii TaxID=2820661 RepID=UPI002077971B|nr:hypothetical protein [Candidatus Arcticimaribacter forsetii]MDA8640613.1 hypothetical protein [Flavobacteriaceae bacterium]MDA8698962.1 hypothetical protein [Flavobacteriaceae bacterium]MDB2328934.1 hypothetical protein [Flavobacteriaceae bacterium]MDB2345232.1 hypothetical protein [Flavobacteriaceae bacterium]MDB4620520.1 hypothetical protein [Flavobacteriaceae bacterium]